MILPVSDDHSSFIFPGYRASYASLGSKTNHFAFALGHSDFLSSRTTSSNSAMEDKQMLSVSKCLNL